MRLDRFFGQSVLDLPTNRKRRWLPFWLMFGTLIWACHDSRFEGRDHPLDRVQLASAAVAGMGASSLGPTDAQSGAQSSAGGATLGGFDARVQGTETEPAPTIRVRAFHDRNLNGLQDEGEEEIIGWPLEMTDPNLVTHHLFAPAYVSAAEPGTYTFIQPSSDPGTVHQTVSQLDGIPLSHFPAADPMVGVLVSEDSEPTESHEVVFGNVGLGDIKSCMVYDRDANGEVNSYEPGVPGWQLEMSGIDASGASVGPLFRASGPDGCVSFGPVLPGEYTVTQLLPTASSWTPSSAGSRSVTLESSVTSFAAGESLTLHFTNFCQAQTRFETADYWLDQGRTHELAHNDIDHLSHLPVTQLSSADLASPSRPEDLTRDPEHLASNSAFSPTPGPAATANDVDSWNPEEFTNDPHVQFSRQLLAFVLNTRHRLDSPEAYVGNGKRFVSPQDILAAASNVLHGSPTDRQRSLDELEGYNTASELRYIPFSPCPVNY